MSPQTDADRIAAAQRLGEAAEDLLDAAKRVLAKHQRQAHLYCSCQACDYLRPAVAKAEGREA